MKQVAGKLKLDLAQYRELAAFSQFESDLDATTKQFLDRGARMTQLLRQKNNHPLDLAHQVVNLWIGIQGFLDKVPVADVVTYVGNFLEYVELKDKKIFAEIAKNKIIDKKEEEALRKLVEEFAQSQEKTEKKK
jgi:F-type H+-transporting ATPase subunit alpha